MSVLKGINQKHTWAFGIVSTLDSAISQTLVYGTKNEVRKIIFQRLAHAQDTDSEYLLDGVKTERDIRQAGNMLTGEAEFKDYKVIATATIVDIEHVLSAEDELADEQDSEIPDPEPGDAELEPEL